MGSLVMGSQVLTHTDTQGTQDMSGVLTMARPGWRSALICIHRTVYMEPAKLNVAVYTRPGHLVPSSSCTPGARYLTTSSVARSKDEEPVMDQAAMSKKVDPMEAAMKKSADEMAKKAIKKKKKEGGKKDAAERSSAEKAASEKAAAEKAAAKKAAAEKAAAEKAAAEKAAAEKAAADKAAAEKAAAVKAAAEKAAA